MTLDCRPWRSHAACSARELRPVASWKRLWKTEHKQIIDGLSGVCTIYDIIWRWLSVEPLDESPEVTRLGVIFRVARMVFTVSQNDCAANGPKVSYAVPCGRKTTESLRILLQIMPKGNNQEIIYNIYSCTVSNDFWCFLSIFLDFKVGNLEFSNVGTKLFLLDSLCLCFSHFQAFSYFLFLIFFLFSSHSLTFNFELLQYLADINFNSIAEPTQGPQGV